MNLTRRSLIFSVLGAVAVQSMIYGEAEGGTASRMRLARAMSVSLPPAGSFTIPGSGFGDTTRFPLNPPTGGDTYVYRSKQMTQEESDIGLAEEGMLALGAAPTSHVISGTSAGNFEQASTDGYIRPTAAFWASGDRSTQTLTIVSKRTGCPDSDPWTLQVKFAATAGDEFFVSYQTATGAQSAQTGTKANPWKYHPGSGEYTGTRSTAFGPGQVVFMKGEIHYTSHWATYQDGTGARMDHAGNSTTKCGTEWNAWGAGVGGRGTMDGSQPTTGTPFTPTQPQAGGNALFASLKRLTGQAYIEGFMRVYQDASQYYEANWPTPLDIKEYRRIDYVSSVTNEKYGLRNYPVSSSATPRRIFTNGPSTDGQGGSVTQLTIVDPDFSTLFSGYTNAADITAAGGNLYGVARGASNFFLATSSIISWTPGTNTLVLAYSGTLSTTDGFGSFSLRNHPCLIAKQGQIVVDTNHTDITYYPYSTSQLYISRLYGALGTGNGGYHANRGGQYRRFANGDVHGVGDKSAGIFHWYQSVAVTTGSEIINPWVTQCNVDNGSYGVFTVSSGGNTTSGLVSFRMTHWLMDECNNGSGFRILTGMFRGPAGAAGDKNTIRTTGCEISYGSVYEGALGQTYIYFGGGCDNIWVHHNFVWRHLTIHGNGHSYLNLTAVPNRNILTEFCTYWGYRWQTASVDSSNDAWQYFENNIVLNPSGLAGAALQANGSLNGVRYTRSLMLGAESNYSELYIVQFGPGGTNFDFGNSVVAGINSSAGAVWTGAIHDLDVTVNVFAYPTPSSSGGTLTNNTQYNGTNFALRKYWDGTFNVRDKVVLGLGRIGASHLITA